MQSVHQAILGIRLVKNCSTLQYCETFLVAMILPSLKVVTFYVTSLLCRHLTSALHTYVQRYIHKHNTHTNIHTQPAEPVQCVQPWLVQLFAKIALPQSSVLSMT